MQTVVSTNAIDWSAAMQLRKYGSALNFCRAFADGNGDREVVVIVRFLGVMARAEHWPCSPQIRQRRFLWCTAA